jgi:hypothetical protein
MSEKENKGGRSSTGFDPSIQSEKLGFDPELMVACASCGRNNPPNRVACLYCAGGLPIDPTTVETIRPSLRKPDAWERGFNLILRSSDADLDMERASEVLALEPGELVEIIHSGLPLPLARVESVGNAEAVREILLKLGLSTIIVSDDALAGEKPPRRLRSIRFRGDSLSLILFNTGEEFSVSDSDLFLAVEGVISQSRVDQLEKRRLRRDSKVLDGSSSASIEPVLDLYTRDDQIGFRIQPAGFDFSCLGDEKVMLSANNFKTLTGKIVNFSPTLRYVSEYPMLRKVLGRVWEIESREESAGLRHTGLGQKAFGTISSTSNLIQFTRFSRLLQQFL